AARALFPPAVLARRLAGTAYLLAETARALAARRALAVALVLGARPADAMEIPLVAALVERAVGGLLAQATARTEEERRGAPVDLDAVGEGAQLARVRHDEGQHAHPVQRRARARRDLFVAHGEGERLGGDALVQRPEQAAHPALRPRRPVHRERTRARLLEAVLHEEEGQAPEVIAVEVREEDEVHRAGVAAGPLERLQDGRPAVEEEGVA